MVYDLYTWRNKTSSKWLNDNRLRDILYKCIVYQLKTIYYLLKKCYYFIKFLFSLFRNFLNQAFSFIILVKNVHYPRFSKLYGAAAREAYDQLLSDVYFKSSLTDQASMSLFFAKVRFFKKYLIIFLSLIYTLFEPLLSLVFIYLYIILNIFFKLYNWISSLKFRS